MTALTRAVAGEKQIYSGNLEILLGIKRHEKFFQEIRDIFGTMSKYRKIPKISPGAYIFQRPFLRGLCTEGNLRFKIDWASLIVGSKFTVFALFYFVFESNFQVQAPRGLIFGGAI